MSDDEIKQHLADGWIMHFGCNARNQEVMDLMHRLEEEGFIKTRDASLSQETRREAIRADLLWEDGKTA